MKTTTLHAIATLAALIGSLAGLAACDRKPAPTPPKPTTTMTMTMTTVPAWLAPAIVATTTPSPPR